MATYLDTSSLAPSADLAAARCRELQLSGQRVPILWRLEVLQQAGAGDTVICGPQALDFWRKLSPHVRLYSVADLTNADPLPSRIDTWAEWAMVQQGLSRTEARRYLETPPRTAKHKHYVAYHDAVSLAALLEQARPVTLPTFDQVEVTKEQAERSYTWTLVDGSMDALIAATEAFERAHETDARVGYDVETDVVLDHPNEYLDKLVGAAVAFGQECFYGSSATWLAALAHWLPKLQWVGHHAKYDLLVSRRHSIMASPPAGDSLLAAFLLGVPEAGLKKLVRDRYGEQMITYEEVAGSGKAKRPISEVDIQTVAEYCSGDAYWALRATDDLEGELDEQHRKLYQIDLQLVPILAGMEERGIAFDRAAAEYERDGLKRQRSEYERAIDMVATESGWSRPVRTWVCSGCRNGKNKRVTCNECHGVGQFSERQPLNPGSSDQVASWLHDHLKLPIQALTDTGKPSVNALSLLRLRDAHAGPGLILRWKQLDKFISFEDAWLEWSAADGSLHPVATMARVRSGRLSYIDPNLQQVKRDWRRYFVARPGMALSAADYGQIELRVAAKLSGDPKLVAIMTADPKTREGDLHGQNVERLFGVAYADQQRPDFDTSLRVRAKNYGFGALYLSEGQEVQQVLEKQILADDTLDMKVPTVGEIHAAIEVIRDTYSRCFHEWMPAVIARAEETGGWVYTMYGRPRYLPELVHGDKYQRKHAARQAISHIVQGTAADIMRFAMFRLDTELPPEVAMLLSVHDEIVLEAPVATATDYMPLIVETMQLGQPLMPVPITVDVKVAANWYAAH